MLQPSDRATIDAILAKQAVISDQVSLRQIKVILEQLMDVIRRGVPGDVVELGCYKGTTSLFIKRLLDTTNGSQKFYAYDSFEGLPAKSSYDNSPSGEQFIAGELSTSKKGFLAEFKKANIQPPIVHRGWFDNLRDDQLPDSIAFAFLDGDFYDSIVSSLQIVLPRIKSGGIIIVDDYQNQALPGVARAISDFKLNARPIYDMGIIKF